MTRRRHMRLWVLLLGACLFSGLAASAHAQNGDRVLLELQQTDRVVEKAQDVVGHALGPRPSNVLGEALSLQRDAWTAYGNRQLLRALELTRAARRVALRAADITKSQLRLLDRVRHVLAENDDLVARAREAVSNAGNAEAQRFLDAGMLQLSRGQRAFDNAEYRQAVRLSLFGRDLVLRALRVAEGERALSKGRVAEEIERTEEFLREAKAEGQLDRAAKELLDDAARLQKKAKDHLERDRLDAARRFTFRARESALDVLQSGREGVDAEEIAAAIDRVGERLRELGPDVASATDGQVATLVGQAEDHLARARAAQRTGKLEEALAEAQLASSMLGQAQSLLR